MRIRLLTLNAAAALGVLVVLASSARGGAQSSDTTVSPGRVLLQDIAAAAIDRGLMIGDESRAPDSAEMVARRELIGPRSATDRSGASGARYAAGRVIVKFRGGVSSASRRSALSTVSRTAVLTERPDSANFDIVRIGEAEDAEVVAREFAARPDVEYAQPAYRVRPHFVPNDTFYRQGLQWNFPAIDLERGWDIQRGGTSAIVVAVLDTGLAFQNALVRYRASGFRVGNLTYPALGTIDVPFVAATELASSGRFVSPRDFVWDDTMPLDLDGHGTHVAGTIGQLTDNNVGTAGVAFNVRLMPVKVLSTEWDDIFNSPFEGTDETVARGIRYAADNGAKIINMSLGRDGPPAPVVEDAIKYAVGKGCFLAISAGNSFEDGNPTEVLAEIASRVQGAVSVGAVDRGHNHAFYSTSGAYVELSAPGGSFRGFSSQGGVLQQTYDLNQVATFDLLPAQYRAPRFDALAYFYFIGTSQAAPHVSGLAALLAEQGITDPAAIEAALEKFATDRGDKGRDHFFGFGEISARDTLRGLGLAK